MKSKKILILTSKTGGGHLNLALSLKDILAEKFDVIILDPSPYFAEHLYRFATRSFMKLWDVGFHYYNDSQKSMTLHKLAKWFINSSLTNSIRNTNPDLVITTHQLLSVVAAHSLQSFQKHIPLVFQLTDTIKVHSSWFSEKNADAYLAPSQEIIEQAINDGIAKQLLHLTGRPVRQQFFHNYRNSHEKIFESLDLEKTKFTIFLQGGADGTSKIESVLHNILDLGDLVQVILAAGTNKKLLSIAKGSNLRILPFTLEVAQYMAIADLVAGKVGASFIFEAITLEKPFLATSFIAGQEVPNLTFIEKHNLGWVCTNLPAQKEIITNLANRPGIMDEKVKSIRDYKKWNLQAQNQVADIIENLILCKTSLQ